MGAAFSDPETFHPTAFEVFGKNIRGLGGQPTFPNQFQHKPGEVIDVRVALELIVRNRRVNELEDMILIARDQRNFVGDGQTVF